MPKFDILDDIPYTHRLILLTVCTLSCCWGFVNNTILLVLAGKIGFPLAVSACSIEQNHQRVRDMLIYTGSIFAVAWLYFFFVWSGYIPESMTKNYYPSNTDAVLAVGLGWCLAHFWHHAIRINIVVMSAGLSSLLPAVAMSAYWTARGEVDSAYWSLVLYCQYVFGMILGAVLNKKIIKD
jgi:hypothetical protein